MIIRHWGIFVLMLLGFVEIFPLNAQAATSTPITAENAAQLRLIDTIPDYKAEGYCNCDVEFFSQNGRVVATDQKVRDLDNGQTLDLTGERCVESRACFRRDRDFSAQSARDGSFCPRSQRLGLVCARIS